MGNDCNFRDTMVGSRRSYGRKKKSCVGEDKIIQPMKEFNLKLRMPIFVRCSDYNPGKITWKLYIASYSQ